MVGTSEKRPASSLAPFASPDHLDPYLKSFLDEVSELLCQWIGKANERGPLPAGFSLPAIEPCSFGRSTEGLLQDLSKVMEGAYQPFHPGSLAHLDPPPLTASIAAELICAGLNNNLLAEELSPSLSSLERKICRWFAARLGLPSAAGGVAASGGSLGNLMALVVARQKANVQFDPKAVVLTSVDSHVSLAKAIRVMGLPDDALQRVQTNTFGQISMKALEETYETLKSQNRKCFALVATAGTTVRGAIDPLLELAEFCKREGIWFHVDGAIGGVFGLSESTAHLIEGVSRANSVTVNPQKLLGIAKTSSLLLVANRAHLANSFATGLPYLEPAWEESHGGEMGIQGSRSAEVLKLWLGIRHLGDQGIKRLLEEAISRRHHLEKKLDRSKLELISGPLHLIACIPKGVNAYQSASWSLETRKSLLKNHFMLSRPCYQGRHYLKAVLGNPFTQAHHLELLATFLNESVEGKT